MSTESSEDTAFDFTPQFEEPATEAAEESNLETAPVVPEVSEEVVDDGENHGEVSASPRVEKRIRQLAGERKELKEEKEQLTRQNEELLALVEQLKRSNELQERTFEKQQEWLGQQERVSQTQQRRQLMLQYGLNPDDTRDAIAFEQMEYKAQLEQQLNSIRQEMEQQQNALMVERFNVALDHSLTNELKGYNVDEDIQSAIRDTAYDIAALRGLTAKEAAAEAVKRYRKALPNRSTNRVAAKVDDAAKAIRTGAATTVSPESSKDLDFLSMLETGKFSL